MDTDFTDYPSSGKRGSAKELYFSGMERFSCTRRTNAEQLCIAAALTGCGIFAGILLFLACGVRADAALLAERYFSDRAFTSYRTAEEFLRFFAGWFLHGAAPLTAALLCAATVHPLLFTRGLCVLRGAAAGFGMAAMSGGFSAFAVYYAAAQSLALSLLLTVSVKSARYARDRLSRCISTGRADAAVSRIWLVSSLLPLLTGWLLSLGALLTGMTAVSAAACFL